MSSNEVTGQKVLEQIKTKDFLICSSCNTWAEDALLPNSVKKKKRIKCTNSSSQSLSGIVALKSLTDAAVRGCIPLPGAGDKLEWMSAPSCPACGIVWGISLSLWEPRSLWAGRPYMVFLCLQELLSQLKICAPGGSSWQGQISHTC